MGSGTKPKTERNQRLLQAAKRGRTYKAIGREFHLSTTRVAEILNRMGYRRRPGQNGEAPDEVGATATD